MVALMAETLVAKMVFCVVVSWVDRTAVQMVYRTAAW